MQNVKPYVTSFFLTVKKTKYCKGKAPQLETFDAIILKQGASKQISKYILLNITWIVPWFVLGGAGNSTQSRGPNSFGGEGGGENGPLQTSNIALIAGAAGGSAFLLLVTAVICVVCYRLRHAKHSDTHHPPLSLSSLTSPKRGGGGGLSSSNNNGSEPSDIIIPLRTSDSAYCPHYEKVSGDYGHPVYIVQEMPPQSPANIYYKVWDSLSTGHIHLPLHTTYHPPCSKWSHSKASSSRISPWTPSSLTAPWSRPQLFLQLTHSPNNQATKCILRETSYLYTALLNKALRSGQEPLRVPFLLTQS